MSFFISICIISPPALHFTNRGTLGSPMAFTFKLAEHKPVIYSERLLPWPWLKLCRVLFKYSVCMVLPTRLFTCASLILRPLIPLYAAAYVNVLNDFMITCRCLWGLFGRKDIYFLNRRTYLSFFFKYPSMFVISLQIIDRYSFFQTSLLNIFISKMGLGI